MIDPRQEWQTPDDLWRVLNGEFDFQLDAAASPHNARCKKFYTAEQDSLSDKCPWITDDVNTVFINPGFKNIGPWCEKAADQMWLRPSATIVIVSLISPSAKWWMKWTDFADEVRLLGGARVQFDPPKGVARSSNARENCILVFRDTGRLSARIWTWDWRHEIHE